MLTNFQFLSRQPGFTYSASGSFTWHCERTKKFKQTGYLNYFYSSKLDKACFVHDAAYANHKDLAKSTISDKRYHFGHIV